MGGGGRRKGCEEEGSWEEEVDLEVLVKMIRKSGKK